MKKAPRENVVYEKAYAFAVKVVKCVQGLTGEKKEFILSKQLIRSGTPIGANLSEANGAISKADFSAKVSIAYKECLETKYWLRLLNDKGYLEESVFDGLHSDADEIARILFSILKTTRINKQ